MTDFPTQDGFFPPAQANVGPVRAGQRQFYGAVRQLLGAQAPTTLTIATGVVTPTHGIHAIDTEGAAAADDLTHISQDNLPDGSLIVLMSADVSRVPTVKHSAGGAGQVLLADSADLALADPSMRLLLRRDGTTWVEEGRFYGANAAGQRAALDVYSTGQVDAALAGKEAADPDLLRADVTDELQVGFTQAVYPLGNTGSSIITPAFANSNKQSATVTGNFTLEDPTSGSGKLSIEFTNDGLGPHSPTISADFKTISGTWDPTPDKVNVVEIERFAPNSYLVISQPA